MLLEVSLASRPFLKAFFVRVQSERLSQMLFATSLASRPFRKAFFFKQKTAYEMESRDWS
eukprot:COSAG02_NODE_66293_length_256_cov_0.299363_1_plen_59_part_01